MHINTLNKGDKWKKSAIWNSTKKSSVKFTQGKTQDLFNTSNYNNILQCSFTKYKLKILLTSITLKYAFQVCKRMKIISCKLANY